MGSLKIVGLVLTVTFVGCTSTSYLRPAQGTLANINNLGVFVVGEPEFKVLDKRATGLGVGVLFGAVGAIANSAYTNIKDSKQEDKLKGRTDVISYREIFIDELKHSLEESKRFEEVEFYEQPLPKRESLGALLELSIQEWGIKLINQEKGGLVPFITIKIELIGEDGRALWKEKDVAVGRVSYTVEEYRAQENLLAESLEAVLSEAANRITSTLIYS